MREFRWIPGHGVEEACLARLREHFPRPGEPMGEAWFMGERRMFTELLGDLATLDLASLQEALNEIPAGYSSFGPRAEWHDWYHYLLHVLLPRANEARLASLLESLITGFMAVYPNGVYSAPYKTFRDDVLLTLGRVLMQRQNWRGRDIVVGNLLHRSNQNPAGVWCWWDASGDFSASMFFCLKYLPQEFVRGWMRSVLEIQSPQWRAQVIVWRVGAHDFLTGRKLWPAQMNPTHRPAVQWEWSHCLGATLAERDTSGAARMSALLPESARLEALHVLETYFTDDVYLDWLHSFQSVDGLETELAELPATFEELYVHQPR